MSALPPPGSLYAGPTPQRIEIGPYRDSAGNYWLPDPDGAIWPISAADIAALENNLGAGEDARKNRQDILQRVRTKNVVGQPVPAGGPIKLDMRRTLLAIGIALLASMLFTPHQKEWGLRSYYNWAETSYFPIFVVDKKQTVMDRGNYYPNPVLWGQLGGQSVFAAVLAAVLVNLRKSRRRDAM